MEKELDKLEEEELQEILVNPPQQEQNNKLTLALLSPSHLLFSAPSHGPPFCCQKMMMRMMMVIIILFSPPPPVIPSCVGTHLPPDRQSGPSAPCFSWICLHTHEFFGSLGFRQKHCERKRNFSTRHDSRRNVSHSESE